MYMCRHYKMPNLSALTKKKNGDKISGKKRTGQASNSIEIATVTGAFKETENKSESKEVRVTRSRAK